MQIDPTWTALIVCASLAITLYILIQNIGFNLSLSSMLLSLLIIFHGPAYLYYTRFWGPETDFFDTILLAAKGRPVLSTLDLALATTFIFVCIGISLTDIVLGTSRKKWRQAIRRWGDPKTTAKPAKSSRVMFASTILIVLVLLPFIFIDNQLPKVIDYFTSDLSEFEKIALRREGGGSEYYPYNLLLSTALPYVAFCLLAMMLQGSQTARRWGIPFLVLVGLAKAATLSKAPLAVFVLQCAVVWLLLRKLTLTWKTIVGLVLFSGSLFMAMSYIANPSTEELQLILEFLFYRIFMIVNEGLLEYFSAIPYTIEHSWGSQLSWLSALFQSSPSLPTYWLVGEVHRGALGSTTTVMFMGDAWAEFSWIGIALTAAIAGATARWIDIQLIVVRGKSITSIAGLTLGHFGLFTALSTSLQTALITGGLAFILPLGYLFSTQMRRQPAVMAAPRKAEFVDPT